MGLLLMGHEQSVKMTALVPSSSLLVRSSLRLSLVPRPWTWRPGTGRPSTGSTATPSATSDLLPQIRSPARRLPPSPSAAAGP